MRTRPTLTLCTIAALLTAALGACSTSGTATPATTPAPATSATSGTAGTPGTSTPAGPGTSTTTASTPTTPGGAAVPAVDIEDYDFNPGQLAVAVGDQVAFTNHDDVEHWVYTEDGVLDSQRLAAGATYQHTFTAPGTVAYYCNIHNGMKGTITVS